MLLKISRFFQGHAIVALALLWPITASSQGEPGTLVFDGLQRSYRLHLPAHAPKPWPLVIVFHGFGGDGENALQQGHWVEKSDAQGFAVLAPDGSVSHADRRASFIGNPRSWNSGSGTGSPAQQRGVDDIGFVNALVEELLRKQPVDPGRIYATGFSNGAAMAFRVGLEMSERIAAIAPVSNSLLVPPQPLARPVSLLLIWGKDDPLNPIEGGRVKRSTGAVNRPSAHASWQTWGNLLHCTDEPLETVLSDRAALRAQRHCDGGTSSQWITV
ncbi:MAG: PHB depolymerase family esterase, partial [Ideonella sp.]